MKEIKMDNDTRNILISNEVFGNIFQRVILIESLIINDVIKL